MNVDYTVCNGGKEISPITSQRSKLAGREQVTSRSVRVVKLNAARQLTQANISRARPALMDLQVKFQVLEKRFKMCNVYSVNEAI